MTLWSRLRRLPRWTRTAVSWPHPDRACPHPAHVSTVLVDLVHDPLTGAPMAYYACVSLSCRDCREPFRWTGVDVAEGYSPAGPTTSRDATELRVPIRPAGQDPDHGLSSWPD